MAADRLTVPIRIVIEDPVPGVRIALQRGATARAALIPPVPGTPDALTFDLGIIVEGALADGRPRLLGPFVQGRRRRASSISASDRPPARSDPNGAGA